MGKPIFSWNNSTVVPGVDPGVDPGADPGAGAGADPGVTFIIGGGPKLGFATGSELGLGEPTTLFSIVVNLDITSFNEADAGAGTGVGEPILSYLLSCDIFVLLMVWFYFFGSKTLGHFL